VLAKVSEVGGWRPVVALVSVVLAALIPIVLILMRERPGDVGLGRYGEVEAAIAPPAPEPNRALLAFQVLGRVAKTPTFWLLFAAFFVCGLTTNGLVGTHLIAYCGDHGISPVGAAGLLSVMGVFDLIGTTGSGWLTDRVNPRRLLFVYFGLRGLSLMVLPFMAFNPANLAAFSVFYGLDWIATVPPVVKLANLRFGERDAPIAYGWIFTGHQLGASVAALGAGLVRQQVGDYGPAFIASGVTGVLIAVVLIAWRDRAPSAVPAIAA